MARGAADRLQGATAGVRSLVERVTSARAGVPGNRRGGILPARLGSATQSGCGESARTHRAECHELAGWVLARQAIAEETDAGMARCRLRRRGVPAGGADNVGGS